MRIHRATGLGALFSFFFFTGKGVTRELFSGLPNPQIGIVVTLVGIACAVIADNLINNIPNILNEVVKWSCSGLELDLLQ